MVSNGRSTLGDKGTRFVVTINTPDDDPEGETLQGSIDQIKTLFDDGKLIYAIGSWERGTEDNRLHIQAWVMLKAQSRVGWFTNQVHQAWACVQSSREDDPAALYACNPEKEGYVSKAFEFGERPSKGAGRRTDLETINGAIASNVLCTFRDVNDQNPGVAARYPVWTNWRLEEAARDELKSSQRYADPYAPTVWQHWLSKYVMELPPDERKIIMVVDKLGHAGKTRWGRENQSSSGMRFQIMRPGRKADMAEALQIRSEVLVIDVPRSQGEYIGQVYSFLEEAKDGEVFCSKYQSRYKPLPNCHIIMFVNDDVDYGQEDMSDADIPASSRWDNKPFPKKKTKSGPPLSHDRYAIWNLGTNHRKTWSSDLPKWGETCPPFQTFTPEFLPAAYHPPFVSDFGSAFSSDMTGDGPSGIVGTIPVVTQVELDYDDYNGGPYSLTRTGSSWYEGVVVRGVYNDSLLDHTDFWADDTWQDQLIGTGNSLAFGNVDWRVNNAFIDDLPECVLTGVLTEQTPVTVLFNTVWVSVVSDSNGSELGLDRNPEDLDKSQIDAVVRQSDCAPAA